MISRCVLVLTRRYGGNVWTVEGSGVGQLKIDSRYFLRSSSALTLWGTEFKDNSRTGVTAGGAPRKNVYCVCLSRESCSLRSKLNFSCPMYSRRCESVPYCSAKFSVQYWNIVEIPSCVIFVAGDCCPGLSDLSK